VSCVCARGSRTSAYCLVAIVTYLRGAELVQSLLQVLWPEPNCLHRMLGVAAGYEFAVHVAIRWLLFLGKLEFVRKT